MAKKEWNFGVDLPLLDIKAQYDLKGKVLILPLVGHGAAELKLIDVKTKVTTNVSFPEVEGRETVRVDKMKVTFTVGGMKVKLHNLFNGNKVLGLCVSKLCILLATIDCTTFSINGFRKIASCFPSLSV